MRKLIVWNWKMHGLAAHLGDIDAIATAAAARPVSADVMICPPATLIARAVRAADGRIAIGGQNCHPEIEGPYTGEISADMLVDAGATAVIVGHSERRQAFGETDADVMAKAAAASRVGLMAIICIGDTQMQRRSGNAIDACIAQVIGSVPAPPSTTRMAIGYEPLWAIETGGKPSPLQIAEMHGAIRACLDRHFGENSNSVPILYGGPLDPANAAELLALPDVDGAMVGGSRLTITEFESVIRASPSA